MRATKARAIPIRIGVNCGSLERPAQALRTARPSDGRVRLRHIKILEELDFTDIVVSLKASDVHRTVAAYRLLSEQVDYPLHLGVTEAGTPFGGTIKSSIGLGVLLQQGIGDTIRVSLAAEPHEEVRVAWEILKSLELRKRVTVVGCPTCGSLDGANFARSSRDRARLSHIESPCTFLMREVTGWRGAESNSHHLGKGAADLQRTASHEPRRRATTRHPPSKSRKALSEGASAKPEDVQVVTIK